MYHAGPSLPREEHKSGINSVRRKSGDLKKSPYTPVGPSAKKYRGKRDKKKSGETRAITETRSRESLGERTESVRVCPTRSRRRQRRETSGEEAGGPIGPREKDNERERKKGREKRREARRAARRYR